MKAAPNLNVPVPSEDGTLLHLCVSLPQPRVAMAEALLEAGADTALTDASGATALCRGMRAAYDTSSGDDGSTRKARIDCCKRIMGVMTQTSLNQPDSQKRTPLFYACCLSDRKLVGEMLALGCNPNASLDADTNCLCCAVGDQDAALVRTLLDNNATSADALTMALEADADTRPRLEVICDIAMMLVQRDGNAASLGKISNGRSVLHAAVDRGFAGAVQCIVEALRKEPNRSVAKKVASMRDRENKTALEKAVLQRTSACALSILSLEKADLGGVDLDLTSDEPLLHAAISRDMLDVALAIVKRGEDVLAIMKDRSSLHHPPLCLVPLMQSALSAEGVVRAIVKTKGAHLEAVHASSGLTPLVAAILAGNLEIVRFLIDCGADVDTSSYTVGERKQLTPLFVALYTRQATPELQLQIVDLVASATPDFEMDNGCRGQEKLTPLMLACMIERDQPEGYARGADLAKCLLTHGADPDERVGSLTPLAFVACDKELYEDPPRLVNSDVVANIALCCA
jgi:ankyrin repeat protein